MKAEILAVGTELLLGDILNTNAQFLAQELAALGIEVYYQTVVGDNPGRLEDTIFHAFSRADLIITTGGLGPTADDLTKETIAAAFGKKLELHQPSMDRLRQYFKDRTMTPNNEKQAWLPQGCTVLDNDWGTAPGCAFEAEGRVVVMLPGPPSECVNMFRQRAMPYLAKLSGGTICSRYIRIFGMGESEMEDKLTHQMQTWQNPTAAPYAKEGECLVRVTAMAENEEKARAMTEPALEELCAILGDVVYGIDVDSLEQVVVQELTARGLTLAVAESCTGGLASKRVTDIPGSSACFLGGVVSYSNEVKERLLGVRHETLQQYGAVSEQVACQMAQGVRLAMGADIGVSTTGVAGPTGSEQKPAGLVYIGLSTKEGTRAVRILKTNQSRDRVRRQASSTALDLVRRYAQGLKQ